MIDPVALLTISLTLTPLVASFIASWYFSGTLLLMPLYYIALVIIAIALDKIMPATTAPLTIIVMLPMLALSAIRTGVPLGCGRASNGKIQCI